jgi:PPM family protein phosphatase
MAELRAGGSTHKGQIRPENEDNLLVTDRLFIVADGMGGHEAGEIASQIAVDRISELLDGDDPPSAQEVVDAIRVTNGDIFRAAIANPEQHGMGTTVTVIAVIADAFAGRAAPNIGLDGVEGQPGADPGADGEGDGTQPDETLPGDVTPVIPAEPSEALVLANVGDSRTYLFRHGRLRRVTVDHSYVQELVATGHISEDEARDHPRRNIITRALGIEPEVRVDWWTLPLIRGDRFVLCSDGLVDEVADVDIASTLAIESDPQVAADRLVDKANEAGGRDNITVVVLDVLEGDDPPDATQELDLVPVWADTGTDPTPAGTLELDPDADSPFAAAATAGGDSASPRRSTLVRLGIGFAVAAVLVIIFVVFSVWARSGWFVAFNDQDQAVIYQAVPGARCGSNRPSMRWVPSETSSIRRSPTPSTPPRVSTASKMRSGSSMPERPRPRPPPPRPPRRSLPRPPSTGRQGPAPPGPDHRSA